MKFKTIKEVPESIERWEKSESIPKGTICETAIFDRVETISYKEKLICDSDSEMAKDYLRK